MRQRELKQKEHVEEVGAAGPAAEIGRLFELSNDLLATFTRDGRFTRLNPAWERVLGWTRAELMAQPVWALIHPDDLDATAALGEPPNPREVVAFENRFRHRDGTWRWLLWSARTDGRLWYGVAKDVTHRKELERRALHDPLTDLPNRTLFMDRLEHALARSRRSRDIVAVLFVDLDRFKLINDGLGHDVGDRILVSSARRLRAALREGDTVARFGGDEFVILAESVESTEQAIELAQRVRTALERDFEVRGGVVGIGASVGVALAGATTDGAEQLLREADVAMYRAKGERDSQIALFDEPMRTAVRDRMTLEGDLRRAVERDELRVEYQPIVSLSGESIVGCEALVRWEAPRRGRLLPGAFIPLAEETGLISEVGDWVLGAACRQGVAWRRAGSDVGVAVNVSPQQLTRPDAVEAVAGALGDAGFPPEALCLEITETALAPDAESLADNLGSLRDLGVRVAIDDFGRGFSSLSFLRSLPLDILKIDRSFVAGIERSRDDRAIVAAVISLAREMELPVVAEGVETEWQHEELCRLGCDFAQGFLYARPRPADDLSLPAFVPHGWSGTAQPLGVHEIMRQLGIRARIEP